MKPIIDSTSFGSITIGGREYQHDVMIRLDGTVDKRRKELSKREAGTSHQFSRAEAEHVFQPGAERLILGTGQTGLVELTSEAAALFAAADCKVDLYPTPRAIEKWNEAKGAVIGLFHVTC